MVRVSSALVLSVLGISLFASPAQGASILVGLNAATTAQLFSLTGVPQGSLGSNASSAAAVAQDGSGLRYSVLPGDSQSSIFEYNAAQLLLNTYTFTGGIANGNGPSNYITDIAWAGPSVLWLAGFNGFIYQVQLAGTTATVADAFDSGNANTGVAANGTTIYTTGGLSIFSPLSSSVLQWTKGGSGWQNTDTFIVPLLDTLGIGYASDGTLWVGGFDTVSNVNTSGDLLATIQVSGQASGVELGTLDTPVGIPEPSSALLFGGGVALFCFFRFRGSRAASIVATFGPSAMAAVSISNVATSLPTPQPVGTPIAITAAAADTDPGPIRYRFRIRPSTAASWVFIQDFGSSAEFTWTPSEKEGDYLVEVSALNRTTGSTAQTTVPYTITPRATTDPVVSPSGHPLVALYSYPACPAGGQVRVRFKRTVELYWQSTPVKPCNGTTSLNFYVAGMLANQTYNLVADRFVGSQVTSAAPLTFNSGSINANVPVVTPALPLVQPTRSVQGITLFSVLDANERAFAVDADTNVIWYYPFSTVTGYLTRPTPGGTFLTLFGIFNLDADSGFLEYDLAGNTLKKTNVEQLNAQLTALGKTNVNLVHHEVRRLPNGNYIVLTQNEMLSTAQGTDSDGNPLDIAGDVILILNPDLQVLWVWNAFDHLDITRSALLHETCSATPGGCKLKLATVANDWLHSNSVQLTPDGNLLMSIRHQDWVLKIAYQNGAGDGHIIWRMGPQGDFTINSAELFPWFSHQHDPEYETAAGPNVISVYDNGNTRVRQNGGNSRGQVLQVDEANRVVTPLMNADLGRYSLAVGSAQRLVNGNYSFDSGILLTQSNEVRPDGSMLSRLDSTSETYRSFRMRDMYSAPW